MAKKEPLNGKLFEVEKKVSDLLTNIKEFNKEKQSPVELRSIALYIEKAILDIEKINKDLMLS